MLKTNSSKITVLFFISLVVSLLYFEVILNKNLFVDNIYYGLEFSLPSGSYDSSIDLRVIGPGAVLYDVYYTTNGNNPTTEDKKYTGKIKLESATDTIMNSICNYDSECSVASKTEVLEEYSDIPPIRWVEPSYNLPKCNVIKAACFNKKGEMVGNIIEGVFYIGRDINVNDDGVYTLSIETDMENLFSYENGIFVLGKRFNDYYNSSIKTQNNTRWWEWPAGYNSKIEKPAHAFLIDGNRNPLIDADCTIKVHGGASAAFLPKSLTVENDEVRGGKYFETSLFGGGNISKFIVSNGGNDNKWNFLDFLANHCAQELNISTMEFIPCRTYLNGEYYGFHFITQSYDKTYFVDKYGVGKNNIVMVKAGNEVHLSDNASDIMLYHEMLDYVSDADMTKPENYAKVCELVDIDSCIDYYASQLYINRFGDWPTGNFALWRTIRKEKSPYGDCKWRWILYDANSGSFSDDYCMVDFKYVMERDTLFASLWDSPSFREKFVQKLVLLEEGYYSLDEVNSYIDEYIKLKDYIIENNIRYYGTFEDDEYLNNLADIRKFIKNRPRIINHMISNCLGEETIKYLGESFYLDNVFQTHTGIEYTFCGDYRTFEDAIIDGISINEKLFSWTDSLDVKLKFRVISKNKRLMCNIKIAGIYGQEQTVLARVNGEESFRDVLTSNDQEISFSFDNPDGVMDMELEIPDAPLVEGRYLGLMLRSITFVEG